MPTSGRHLVLPLLASLAVISVAAVGWVYFMTPSEAEQAEATVHTFAELVQRGRHYAALNMWMDPDGGFVPPLDPWVDEMEERLGSQGEKLRLNYTVVSVGNTGNSAKFTGDIWNVTVAGEYCLLNSTGGWKCETFVASFYVAENTELHQWGLMRYVRWE